MPELSPGLKGSASSVTKSAIADGKVVVTKETIDISQINRNTANTLNTLDKIFDKKKVEEKQELAKLFAKNVNEAIHMISANKGWKDGSPQKVALHTFFAGIEGELFGNGFSSGALAGGVNELVAHKLLEKLGTNNPDLAQIASAALGYATNKLAGKEGFAGAAIAQYGTKWNLVLENIPEFRNSLRTDSTVKTLPLGYGHIVGVNVGRKVVGAGENAIIFNADGGNPVFITTGGSVGWSADFGITPSVGKIWVTAPNGGVVVDPEIIIREMQGWDWGFDYGIMGASITQETKNGYKINVLVFSPDLHVGVNGTYTEFLGYQNQI